MEASKNANEEGSRDAQFSGRLFIAAEQQTNEEHLLKISIR
jgi:hypothetical protein